MDFKLRYNILKYVDKLVLLNRNVWSFSTETAGLFAPKYLVLMLRILQQVSIDETNKQKIFNISVDSDPIKVKIEVNGEIVGKTPLKITLSGKTEYTIIAYPKNEKQYEQKKELYVSEGIPKKLYFNMFVKPKEKVEIERNVFKEELIKNMFQ